MVKLVFVLDPPPTSGPNAERMWVEVRTASADGTYDGWLTNQPVVITSLDPPPWWPSRPATWPGSRSARRRSASTSS